MRRCIQHKLDESTSKGFSYLFVEPKKKLEANTQMSHVC